jgi:hypothetical protein
MRPQIAPVTRYAVMSTACVLLCSELAYAVACFNVAVMEEHALNIVNNCSNTKIYSYLEASGGQSYNLYLNVVHFLNTSLN